MYFYVVLLLFLYESTVKTVNWALLSVCILFTLQVISCANSFFFSKHYESFVDTIRKIENISGLIFSVSVITLSYGLRFYAKLIMV